MRLGSDDRQIQILGLYFWAAMPLIQSFYQSFEPQIYSIYTEGLGRGESVEGDL